jgi:hypothetical protein
MEILALKLLVPEDAVNALLAERLPPGVPVRKLAVRITPEGVRVQGEYPTVFMSVAFETLWSVAAAGGVLELRLADLKVSGFPATMLRGLIFKVLKESTGKEPGLSVEGETLRIDLDRFLAAKGLPLKSNLRGVLCGVGSLVVEAGPDTVLV